MRLVLLAAPDQLDRDSGKLLRNRYRFVDEVLRAAAPTKASAEVGPVDLALGERHPGGLRECGEGGFRILRRHPRLGFVGGNAYRGIHRLHRRVSEEGSAVDRLDLFGGCLDRFERIAIPAVAIGDLGGEPFLHPLGDGRARYGRVRTLVPKDRQCFERRFCPPPCIGDDRDRGVLHFHHFPDAGSSRNLCFIVAGNLPAEHRTILDHGAQHARQPDVDAENLAAVELVGSVKPFQRLAGDLPVFRILEPDRFGVGCLNLGCGRRELSIAQRASRRGVHDDAVGDREFANRDLPLLGGHLQQHHARRGAAAAHVIVRGTDTAAAAG